MPFTCKRSHWFHDGHVVWRHIFVLKLICRAISAKHSRFLTLRKVANKQNFSLLQRRSAKINFVSKYPKSRFCKDLENFPDINNHITAVSKRYTTLSQQPALIRQPTPTQQLAFIHQPAPSRQPAFILQVTPTKLMPASLSYHFGS